VSAGRASNYDAVKRALDVVIASIALVITLPIQLVVGVLVLRNFGRPVFFRQARPGRDGRLFTLVKFRTMRDTVGAVETLSDSERITPFGQRLRSTSLDELPTLLNVLRGDMSFVGPRPLLVQYLSRYNVEQARRHEVRPGITGLAQVSGRNSLGWSEKFDLDVQYVEQRSFRLDTKIMLRTVKTVIRKDGISSPNHVTAAEFTGSPYRSTL
jgi:lipopolysaccharide/colanic/teichoic acid biosynthesis glycosyltransferase